MGWPPRKLLRKIGKGLGRRGPTQPGHLRCVEREHNSKQEWSELATAVRFEAEATAPPSEAITPRIRSSSAAGADGCSVRNRSVASEEHYDDRSTHQRAPAAIPKVLVHSNSVLDEVIKDQKSDGDLKSKIIHIEVPSGKAIEEIYDGVQDGHELGYSFSGPVHRITHKSTGAEYAVKCLDLRRVTTEEGIRQLREEISIMCQLDHPNIVRLEEVYETHNEIYLVQELCLGGELFDRLDKQSECHYNEAQCARLVRQMLSSVQYLHSQGIIHRDLKLENFLFSSKSPDSQLKMIDFGLSKHFKRGEWHHEFVGTRYTIAPEVYRGCYDERCDIWAIGVITFLLLSGEAPFGGCYGEPPEQVEENILRGRFEFEPPETWGNVSRQAKDFIRRLLAVDPYCRPTAKEAQNSQWLQKWAHSNNRDRGGGNLNPNVVKALVSFKEYSDMRKLLCEVLSFTLLPDQIEDLWCEFEKLDTDGSGEVTLVGFKKVLMNNAGAGSLSSLTEEEVKDIFNAMRLSKTETRIHWHEFVAAALVLCKVDDRNLRLAFDRLDSGHKGYVTFEDVMGILGNDAPQNGDIMRQMWGDSIKACNCQQGRIRYDDFLLLMKGQAKQDDMRSMGVGMWDMSMKSLEAVEPLQTSSHWTSRQFRHNLSLGW